MGRQRSGDSSQVGERAPARTVAHSIGHVVLVEDRVGRAGAWSCGDDIDLVAQLDEAGDLSEDERLAGCRESPTTTVMCIAVRLPDEAPRGIHWRR